MPGWLAPGARVHLIGIGGTGMAALAGMLKESGYRVSGSDLKLYPPTSDLLRQWQIPVAEGYRAENLPEAPDLVIVGNALSRGNPEVEAMLDRRVRYESMSRTIKELFLEGRQSLVVAGTHGKTTTTSLLAWILDGAGLAPGFLIGGWPENYPAGCRVPAADSRLFVIEGDEYDTAYFDKGPKFHHYRPWGLILTSVEYDHADIYADLDALKLAFRRLVNLAPANGVIVAYGESAAAAEVTARAFCKVETYGLSAACHWQARNLETRAEKTRFEIWRADHKWLSAEIQMSGEHNVLNALAAAAMASRFDVGGETLARALAAFRGVKRRMEVRGEAGGVTVIDDFAHHPTAIRETLRAARLRFPGRRIIAVLEPRSNTLRRRVFETELAASLRLADRVALAAVYQGASIPEEERLRPERVVHALGHTGGLYDSADRIVQALVPDLKAGDIVVIMSNGGFDGIHEKLLEGLKS